MEGSPLAEMAEEGKGFYLSENSLFPFFFFVPSLSDSLMMMLMKRFTKFLCEDLILNMFESLYGILRY